MLVLPCDILKVWMRGKKTFETAETFEIEQLEQRLEDL